MQKVWILEKFVSVEDLENVLVVAMEEEFNAKHAGKSEEILTLLSKMTELQEKNLQNNPNGAWFGQEGKVHYQDFCKIAQENLRRNKGKGYKFRVIEAEVEDNSATWVDYKFVKENEGVLKYLYATL